MMGDFNFVMSPKERWSATRCDWAENGDKQDAEVLEDYILKPFGLVEWEQSHFTCQAKGARARLDRVYVNQHVAMKLDMNCRAFVYGWCDDLSAHRPIGISRSRGGDKSQSKQPLKTWPLKHKDFADRVQVQYNHVIGKSSQPNNALQKLHVLKDAVRFVHDRILEEKECQSSDRAEDNLGWAIMYSRAIERQDFVKAERIASILPTIKSCAKPEHKSLSAMYGEEMGKHIQGVRDLIVDLAREDISDDVHRLSTSTSGDEDKMMAKEHILKKLKRLSPNEMCSINCIKDQEGRFHTTAADMARALCEHWKLVFSESQCDVERLTLWMDALFERGEDGNWKTGMAPPCSMAWKIQRHHLVKAIKHAKSTMPGPDGIPSVAFRSLGDFGVDVLWEVLSLLQKDDALEVLTAFFSTLDPSEARSFNESILCLLPKKVSGADEINGAYYETGATRPLSVSNVDSRILASAARLAWEPLLELWISKAQRGFLKGRQMLHNLIDVDWEGMRVSLKCPTGALVLFDFKAAFPSVSHSFLIRSLQYIGLPKAAINLIRAMYHNNTCYIRLQGEDFMGFSLLGGVKQGCPLSPLLFATCVDLLLRMLDHKLSGLTCRAFADDIAAIVKDWWQQGPIMESVFSDFHLISNLELNINKTVCIPLWPEGIEDIRHNIGQRIPSWANLAVKDCGTYLGFVIGPGKGSQSWEKPLARYTDRVRQWSKIGGGRHFATLAYNTFAISTLMFIGQLEQPPQDALNREKELVVSMYPGGTSWIIPSDAWYAKEMYGFAKSAQPLCWSVRAAQLRVAVLGCHFGVKHVDAFRIFNPRSDNIDARWTTLHNDIRSSDFLYRVGLWRNWYDGCFVKTLVMNKRWLYEQKHICAKDITRSITGLPWNRWDGEAVDKVKSSFQKFTLLAIKGMTTPNPNERIRYKVERWRNKPYGLMGLPGHYMYSIHKVLLQISKEVPPRVHAAVYRTLFNGGCTSRRFQGSGKCLFMCGGGAKDSIEHYCRCPSTMRVARSYLRVDYPSELALTLWLLNSGWLAHADARMGLSLLIYGVYSAFNTLRQGRVNDQQQVHHLIVQHCKQGAFGHPQAMKFLDSRWQNQNIIHII